MGGSLDLVPLDLVWIGPVDDCVTTLGQAPLVGVELHWGSSLRVGYSVSIGPACNGGRSIGSLNSPFFGQEESHSLG